MTSLSQEIKQHEPEWGAHFFVVVQRCRQLKEEGKLLAGVEFFINDEKVIDVRPVKLDSLRSGRPFDIRVFLPMVCGSMHSVRHSLSIWFDVSAEDWNSSSIGKLLKFLSNHCREASNKIDTCISQGKEPMYNMCLLSLFSETLLKMEETTDANPFRKASKQKKFEILNKFADEASEIVRRRLDLVTASQHAEMFILTAELQKLRPGEIDDFIDKIAPKAEIIIEYFGAD